ncbi:MAG: pectinesterase family protein [Flavobacterium sp.]
MKLYIGLLFVMLQQSVFSFVKDTLVVAKDGTGNFTSLQEAIQSLPSFPSERQFIYVKKGIYYEKVVLPEWNPNVTIIGEDANHTIISFDDHFDKVNKGRNSTFYTPTLLVAADDVLLKNLTIENSSGDVGQAIALSITSHRVRVVGCRILGNQDTLYLSGTGKKYFFNCHIEGTTDYIFGNAPVFFEECTLHSKKDSYITAASTPEHQEYGFVFSKCQLTSESNLTKLYLGRPWRPYATTVFLHCFIEAPIAPQGWHPWNQPEAEMKVFYAEFKNYGPGSIVENRVGWCQQLTSSQAKKFTKIKILNDGTDWYTSI